ncbi:MAG: diacylglycerol/lipid kinase family protein [Vicinamibacteria bacterium]
MHRGLTRGLALAAAAIAFAAALLLMLDERLLEISLIVGGMLVAGALARFAISERAQLASVPAPQHPALIFNPKSGGGKAERFSLAAEARARGIEPIELTPGKDLERIARDAVAAGADALAMAGTRNHFALDLGVDRDDVVGALDAFVSGRERRVDLGEVNGRVFVNNVSLGVYAEAVQSSGYRDAKLRTLLDTMPDAFGSHRSGLDLGWTGPDGHEHRAAAVILVSNNRYRLGRAIGSGTRPAIDDGLLGIAIAGAPAGGGERGRALQRPVRQWSAPTFEVRADQPVAAGIDGEALRLDPPLRFSIRPLVLRVRIAPQHPGASPSALLPEGSVDGVRALWRIAAGRGLSTVPPTKET